MSNILRNAQVLVTLIRDKSLNTRKHFNVIFSPTIFE